MGPVVADMSVSLDGFVADEDDVVEGVFSWYAKPQPQPQPPQTARDGAEGDEVVEAAVGMRHELGALIYGRRTFEIAHGWGGSHPTGAPVIVVSHSVPDGWPRPDGMVRFAAGIDEALEMARAVAVDKVIAIATPSIARQLLDRALLDGVRLSGSLANQPRTACQAVLRDFTTMAFPFRQQLRQHSCARCGDELSKRASRW